MILVEACISSWYAHFSRIRTNFIHLYIECKVQTLTTQNMVHMLVIVAVHIREKNFTFGYCDLVEMKFR